MHKIYSNFENISIYNGFICSNATEYFENRDLYYGDWLINHNLLKNKIKYIFYCFKNLKQYLLQNKKTIIKHYYNFFDCGSGYGESYRGELYRNMVVHYYCNGNGFGNGYNDSYSYDDYIYTGNGSGYGDGYLDIYENGDSEVEDDYLIFQEKSNA